MPRYKTELELLRPDQTSFIDGYCVPIIEKRQQDEYDPAHGKLHLGNAALLTDAWGIAYRLRPNQRLVLRTGGFLHDIQRSATEEAESALKDEVFSGKVAESLLEDLNNRGMFPSSDTERRAVRYAIETHGRSPWMEEPKRIHLLPQSVAEKFRDVLFISDKMEQIDLAPAVLRRAMFVSGKRLEVGDLSKMGLSFESEVDRLKAFLQESVVRVTFVNAEKNFPSRIRKVIDPLYIYQKNFIQALSKGIGINSSEGLAGLLLGIQDTHGKNVLDVRGVKYSSSVPELARVIEDDGGLSTDGILASPEDSVSSAREAILYFSSRWRDQDLNAVVNEWTPKGTLADSLKRSSSEYVGGKWVTDMQQRIL